MPVKKTPYVDYGKILLTAFQSIGWGAREIEKHCRQKSIDINSAQISAYLTGQVLPLPVTHGIFVDILSSNRAQRDIVDALNQRYAQAAPESMMLLDRVAREAPLKDRVALSKNFVELLDALIEEKFPGDTEHSYLKTRQALAKAGYLSASDNKRSKIGLKADLHILEVVIDLFGPDNKDRSFTYQHGHDIIAETAVERLARYYLEMKIISGKNVISTSSYSSDIGVKRLIFPAEYLAQTAKYAKEEHNFPLLIQSLKQASTKDNNTFFMRLLENPQLGSANARKLQFIYRMRNIDHLDASHFDSALQSIFGTECPAWAKGDEICNTAAHFLESCRRSNSRGIHYEKAYGLAETQWPEPTPQTVQAIAERLTGVKALTGERPNVKIDTIRESGRIAQGKAITPSVTGHRE